jgi:glycosyltransferase involved in cell wall biosynthesis
MEKPRLLVVSHVHPFPRNSGQQQRVYYKLKAMRAYFRITFLTTAPPSSIADVRDKLLEICDNAIVLPSRYAKSITSKLWHRFWGVFYVLRTGLKLSNYLIGEVEFSPHRLADALAGRMYQLVLFEYWHGVACTEQFHQKGIPSVLDMHNILWQSYKRQLEGKRWVPNWLKERAIEQYKQAEEYAWLTFDGLIAINKAEYNYTRERIPQEIRLFYVPMGTDLTLWPYSWQPTAPPRIAYYGGLGNPYNQRDALSCHEKVMQLVWQEFPQAELWLVGSNPPDFLREIPHRDGRVKVTGFVEEVQDVLKTMTVVVCPWSGTYGFRSRLVEVMALGLPVVASPQAVYGMGMEEGKGIFLEETFDGMVVMVLRLLREPEFARKQSYLAREQMETKFSYQATYQQFAKDLYDFANK